MPSTPATAAGRLALSAASSQSRHRMPIFLTHLAHIILIMIFERNGQRPQKIISCLRPLSLECGHDAQLVVGFALIVAVVEVDKDLR